MNQINTRILGSVQQDIEPIIHVNEGSNNSKNSGSRIEVVEWQGSESSHDQKSQANSESLSHLMVGPQVSHKDKDDKLTIDNLWKILAHEKPGDAQKASQAQQMAQANYARNGSSQHGEVLFKSHRE